MSSQLGAISSVNSLIGKIFTQPKGDLAARLNSRITVTILAVSAGLLLTTHFWGEPITCWLPAEFTKSWTDFANQYCYVHGTYFSHLHQPLNFNEHERQMISIDYYQWVPYVLALQAIFFYIPRFVWKILSGFSGYDLPSTVQYVAMTWHNVKTSSFTARMDTLERQTAIYIWDGIRLAKKHKRGQLSMHYLLYTLIQACNATLMFLWLNQLIDSPMYSWSGPSILVDLYNGLNWKTETVLCVLTLNIYYEKLLLFLWFWMLFVAVVSWFNCITWARIMCVPQASKFKLQSFLSVHAGSSVYMDRFFRALGPDGVFILHQISLNIGELPTRMCIWNIYLPHFPIFALEIYRGMASLAQSSSELTPTSRREKVVYDPSIQRTAVWKSKTLGFRFDHLLENGQDTPHVICNIQECRKISTKESRNALHYLTLAMFNILEQAEDNGDQSHSPLLIEKGTKAI